MTRARLAAAGLAAALLAGAANAGAAGFAAHVPGEVLVRFREDAAAARRASAIAAHAHLPIAEVGGGFTHVKLRPGETVEEAIAAYAEDPAVELAQPNFVYRAFAAPTDPTYGQQWALRNGGQAVTGPLQGGAGLYGSTPGRTDYSNPGTAGADIGAEAAWDLATDCSAAVVAVVDTGVKYDHEDLAANMWTDPSYPNHGDDFVDRDGDPMDENGHGTHVAGIVGARANNGVGTVGVCWTARIMAVRVLDRTGVGSTATVASGVHFAWTHGAKVINLSLGAGADDRALESELAAAVNAGAVLVVAAGNDGSDDDRYPTYPCASGGAGILCVAALDQTFRLASFSNWGATTVDVAAPGTNVAATWPGTGTVISEPFTTGWNASSTSGTGFAPVTLTFGTHAYPGLADPPTNVSYAATTDDRIWKSFDTSGADFATVDLWLAVDVSSGDHARIACRATAVDPFAGGTLLDDFTGAFMQGWPQGFAYDLTGCRGPASALGFQLTASPPSSVRDLGVAVLELTVRKLAANTTSYNVESGTSMATPVVAGVAALVRAYQPAFTPDDVVGAITGGGTTPAGDPLAGKIRSARAVSALGALRFVNPPRGLTATIQ